MTNETTFSDYTEQENKIFRAALRVFAGHGKDGATIQLIADEAEANKALVHYYFRSKERLYSAVFGYVLKNYFRLLAESMTVEKSFKMMLAGFVERYINMLRDNPDVVQFIVGELIRNPEQVHDQIAANIGVLPVNPFQAFSAQMQEAIDRGEIRDSNPMHTFISILGACIMPFIMYPIGKVVMPEFREDMNGVMEQRKQHVFDLIYNGLRP